MTPSEQIHEALMRFKAEQLLNEAPRHDSVAGEPLPAVTIVEENLLAVSSSGVPSYSHSHPTPLQAEQLAAAPVTHPVELENMIRVRQYAQRWATGAGIAAVVAILASAAPFSPPIRKGSFVERVEPTAASASVPAPVTSPVRRRASLRVVENSWVSACADGKQIFADLFTPNDTREFWFSSQAVVRVGNASGVDFALDGVSLGPLGSHGRLRRIEIGPDGFRVVPVKPSDGNRDCRNI